MKRHAASAPPEFEGKIDEVFLKKAQAYEIEKANLGIVSSLFGSIVLIAFLFGGLLSFYNSWIISLNLPFIVSAWLFFLLLSYGEEVISIPFTLYNIFKIENKYGFNTMTARLWIADFVKSLIVSTILTSLLLFSAFYLIQQTPNYWWFWVWCFVFAYSMFVMYISPYVIEPLFNKFTPVEDESLNQRIIRLAEKVGIHTSKILKIDASKRSRHTNAYFTGIGRAKRIILYDTLLHGMNHDEIITVLAHEIGHWKKRHLLKMMIIFELFSLIGLFITFKLTQSNLLLNLFNINTDTIFAKFIILAFLFGIIALPLKPLINFFIRKHEREADRTSYELTGDNASMESALIKLSQENLANLYPHPLYVLLYYSHPPVLERIRYIKEFNGF
ncbi:MAG: M48 family metallopeptidase [Deltaproteobacteria bacterium]|nr:M48 family metallopeptidase [Deltaproteobacteria bacterium]